MKNSIDKKVIKNGLLPYLLMLIIFVGVFFSFNMLNVVKHELTYDQFIDKLEKEKIEKLQIVPRGSGYVYNVVGTLDGYKDNEVFESVLPLSEEVMKKIIEASDNQEFKLTVEPDPEASSLLVILVNVVPILLIGGVVFWFLKNKLRRYIWQLVNKNLRQNRKF